MATQAIVKYDPKAKYDVNIFDVVYRKDEQGNDWELRVYQPQGAGPFPALIDVHGGQWNGGDRKQNTLIDTELAESGSSRGVGGVSHFQGRALSGADPGT